MRDIIGYGGGKGGGSSHTHYEAEDSLHSTAYARVLDLVSEGEILGLANGVQSVYLNQTPVQNADGSSNFSGVTVDFRAGAQDQDYIPGFPDVENEISVGVELKSGAPWVHAISNTELSAIRVTLGVPALSKADTTNGDILGYEVAYQIELSKDGGAYSVVLSNSFNGKATSEYQRSARIDLPPATTGWQIRVTRLTPNANTVGIADTTTLVSYTEVIDAKLRYPMSAIVGLQVDAKQFQSIPTRAYDMFGRIIQVPSNYDPVARSYAGVWDGTFKPAWTDNPAWIFRDLVLHDRYGLGNRITAAQLDKWSLYKIARYCDEMVPNGKGGTEPRFTCNLYLQTRKQAYAVLQDIASIFRGISYWGAGSIIASADMPADPVYVYTAANVIGGKFTRSGSKKATRYTVALVTWNDPADFYKPKVEYVEDRDGIARYGIQQVELTAFGCTSQGQAHRAGGWALATSRLETEGITFDVGMDGAIALPGQIVRVADPSRMGRRVGGRVRAVAGRTVTLDKAPTVKAGDRLTVVLPTGVSETRTVASVAGDAVTVSADWSTVPLAQSVWSVDSDELLAPLFRVLSVTEKDETTFTITAVQHEPGKYAYVENGTAITPRPETSTDLSKQAPPASVSLAGYTISLNDVQKLALQISCAPVSGAVAYEGAYRRGNDNWIAIPRQPSPTMDVLDILPGTYIAKMAAVNSIGVTSVETLSAAVEITKDGISRSAALLLTSDAPAFHTNTSGVTDPSTITFTAELIALEGTVTWSLAGGVLSNINGKTAQLRFVDMALAAATVTASVTMYGRTYTKTLRVTKMQDGMDGVDGVQTAVVRLYQFSSAVPNKPAGTSTLVWANAANTNYTGTDGWGVAAGSNPGTPGVRLYVASVSVAAPASATSTQVGYAGALVEAWSANGANGASGLHSGTATVYQWAATIPAAPVGAAEYTWASSSFGAAPSGWTLTSGDAPAPGMTLWAAKVVLVDSASNATTSFNWVAAAIMAVGYAGTSGSSGASYVTAYCASATPTAVGAPDPTTGKTSVPAPNSSGIVGGWSKVVPELAAGQYMYQSDGIYNPATDKVTWSTPYWSSLKVGSLSAISANLGQITAGEINIGNGAAHIDPAGNALFKSIEIQDQNGNTILKSGGRLAPAALPDGTLNAELLPIVYAQADVSLVGRGATVTGNSAVKTAGTNAWDCDVYSQDSFTGGAFASVVVADSTSYYMFGLNSDPKTDGNYTSIDYAILLANNTNYYVYENGAQIGLTYGAFAIGDVFAVVYDGSSVRYLRNGYVFYTSVSAASKVANQVLFFDSSLYTNASVMKGTRFGPMSSNNWASIGGAGKPQDNATVGADASNFKGTVGGDNLCQNSSFERVSNGTLADGWGIYNNSPTSEPAVAGMDVGRSGGRAQVISWENSHFDTKGVYGRVAFPNWVAGATYIVSFYAKTTSLDGATYGSISMFLAWNIQPEAVTPVVTPMLSTSWQRYSFKVKWGASVESDGMAFISIGYGTGGGNVWIDDVMVVEGDVLPAYYPSAAEALSSAGLANAAIANIANDNMLSKGEKSQVILDWATIYNEIGPLQTSANSLGVNHDAFDNAYSGVANYLNSLGNSSYDWQDTSLDTPIVGNDFRAKFNTYYVEKQKLINTMAGKASTMASGVTIGANGTLSGGGTSGQVTLPGMGQNVYRVFAAGGACPPSILTQSGLYKNGQGVYPATRSYYVAMIRRSDGVIVQAVDFDVYGVGAVTGGRNATTMANLLNSYGSDHIAVVWTCDEPFTNRMTGGLDQAMYRCGASRAIFGSPNFLYRSAYILVGIPGCGEGNGAEAYQGSVGNDPNAWCEMSITLANGAFTVSAGYTPRSLVDYGYVGALDATKGATIGTDLGGKFTPENSSTYIADAAIKLAQIDRASITSLSAITATIGLLRTTDNGSRMEMADNVLKVFDANTQIITFGYLG